MTGGCMKEKIGLEELAQYVRSGGSLKQLKKKQVLTLQEYALDIKDIRLYDMLEKFWKIK